jgi:hypothetical protein
MAYVPGYLHDVFISYACADDEQSHLVRQFCEMLERALRAEGFRLKVDDPAGVDVFLDRRRLKAGDDLTEQVLTSARGSAVFIAFHSPAYLASDWCRREATEFCNVYDGARKLEGRLFVVALGRDGSPKESAVQLLRSRRFRRFYYVHPDGSDFAFEPSSADPARRQNEDGYTLREEVTNMAREIAETLRKMQKESVVQRVFVAETSPARAPQAEDIKNWLVQAHVLVLRASSLDADWEAQSRALLQGADLFVDVYEANPPPAAIRQAQLATELGIRRVRWLPRGEGSPADAQVALSETKLIAETLETFKEELPRLLPRVTDRLKPPAGSPAIAGPTAAVAPSNDVSNAMVLVVAATTDEQYVTEIEQVLDRIGCGRDALLSDEAAASPDSWMAELQNLVERYDPASVIFVDGNCSGAWADKRLRDLVLLLRDSAPRANRALCLFPPPNKSRRFRPAPGLVRKLDSTELDRLRELI